MATANATVLVSNWLPKAKLLNSFRCKVQQRLQAFKLFYHHSDGECSRPRNVVFAVCPQTEKDLLSKPPWANQNLRKRCISVYRIESNNVPVILHCSRGFFTAPLAGMSTNDHKARPRDIGAFLANYPGIPRSDPKKDPSVNCLFYLNQLRCQPDNLLIEEMLSKWHANYDELEWNHAYIQWLFPIQEDGVNMDACRLLSHEIPMMRNNEEIICRLVNSYEMMLDFYGMCLLSNTGLLGRSLPPQDFKSRYRNLLKNPHNNLRITRILKCLSELGVERLNLGFILHVLNEQSEHGRLNSASLLLSMDRWWANCIRDDHDRDWIAQTIAKVRSGGQFTRKMYETALEARQSTGRFPPDMTN